MKSMGYWFGSPAWIRTTIHGSKGRCPTIRRPGNSGGIWPWSHKHHGIFFQSIRASARLSNPLHSDSAITPPGGTVGYSFSDCPTVNLARIGNSATFTPSRLAAGEFVSLFGQGIGLAEPVACVV